jgi:hypothetical protein
MEMLDREADGSDSLEVSSPLFDTRKKADDRDSCCFIQ